MDPDIFRRVLESLPMGVYLVDRNRKILWWNEAAEKITGYLGQEVIGRFCNDNILMHCDEKNRPMCTTDCPLLHTIGDGDMRTMNAFLRHKEGQRVPVRLQAVPLRDNNGEIIGAAESFEERVLPDPDANEPGPVLLDHLDQLTSIPDRESTLYHLAQSLAAYRTDHMPYGVIRIRVDKLDELAVTRGKGAVDTMLRTVARTIAKGLRPTDVVGRWNDDGFLVIVLHCPAAALSRVCDMLGSIVREAAIPWWGDRVSVTVSMGATAVHEEDTSAAVISRCEEALETSIGDGGDQYTLSIGEQRL